MMTIIQINNPHQDSVPAASPRRQRNPRLPNDDECNRDNPKRSARLLSQLRCYCSKKKL